MTNVKIEPVDPAKLKQQSKYRLAVLNSHPIQYFAPLYKRIAQESDIDLTVYYCSHQGLNEYVDPGFGEKVQWDIPLLDGYKSAFLSNLRRQDQVDGFFSLINPSIITALWGGQYDALLVHGHNHATYLLAIAVAKLCGIAVFMRCETHLLLKRSSLKQWIRKLLMTAFYHICDVCLPIGTRNAEFYRYHGVTDDRMFLVPYTVDNDFFRQATDEYRSNLDDVKRNAGIPTDKMIILYASKLVARKRPMNLLMAFQRVHTKSNKIALLFVGSGPEEKALRSYVSENNVPDVYFLGFQNQSTLPKFYACADVFVLPSEDEPWGLIVNEVMAAGVPVIATEEIGAVVDLVEHGKNGFIFPTGDIDKLARHLITCAEDVALRQRFARQASTVIAGWSYERCVHGLQAALAYVRANNS